MKIKVLIFVLILTSAVSLFLYERIGREGNKIVHQVQPDNISIINPVKILYQDFKTIDQQKINLQDLEADLILLNFWASWCAPCLKEFPDMVELVKSYNRKITLVAVSIDSDLEAAQQVIHKLKSSVGYPVGNIYWVWDRDKKISLQNFNTRAIPETILIDKKRYLAGKVIGAADWKSKEILSKIESILDRN